MHSALSRVTGRRLRGKTVPLRAAALVGNLRALHQQLADTDARPPPTTLTREELCPSTGVNDAVVPPLDRTKTCCARYFPCSVRHPAMSPIQNGIWWLHWTLRTSLRRGESSMRKLIGNGDRLHSKRQLREHRNSGQCR